MIGSGLRVGESCDFTVRNIEETDVQLGRKEENLDIRNSRCNGVTVALSLQDYGGA